MNEIRNELIHIRNLKKKIEKGENLTLYFDLLLERFEIDLKRQKEEKENELKYINENLELLKIIKSEVEENEK